MASGAPQAKTQRRGDETKRRLIEVTKELLAEFDYQTITLDQIAAAVGVAKSSVIWHFGSKDALLTEAVFSLFEEVDEKITLEKIKLNSLHERIEYLLTSVAEYFVTNPEAKGVTITLALNKHAPAAIHLRIREQWAQHNIEIRKFLSSDTVHVSESAATAIMALMHGTYLQWYLSGSEADLIRTLPESFRALSDDVIRTIITDQNVNE